MVRIEKNRYIITGVQGSGKTTFCQALIQEARTRGWKVAGVLSPPVFEAGKKIGIDVIDLSTNLRKRLANDSQFGGDGPKTIRWTFDADVLAWGNDVLGNIPPCDLLLIDELGPFEFERDEGWLNGIAALEHGDYKIGLVVIRPELVEQALGNWPHAKVLELVEPEEAPVLVERFFRKESLA